MPPPIHSTDLAFLLYSFAFWISLAYLITLCTCASVSVFFMLVFLFPFIVHTVNRKLLVSLPGMWSQSFALSFLSCKRYERDLIFVAAVC